MLLSLRMRAEMWVLQVDVAVRSVSGRVNSTHNSRGCQHQLLRRGPVPFHQLPPPPPASSLKACHSAPDRCFRNVGWTPDRCVPPFPPSFLRHQTTPDFTSLHFTSLHFSFTRLTSHETHCPVWEDLTPYIVL